MTKQIKIIMETITRDVKLLKVGYSTVYKKKYPLSELYNITILASSSLLIVLVVLFAVQEVVTGVLWYQAI